MDKEFMSLNDYMKKLIVAQLIKFVSVFYGSRRFITMLPAAKLSGLAKQ
jgi:hypothetical protein